jgi:hypothetical protein
MKLMTGILDRGLDFSWDTPNGVFASMLDIEMMKKMVETGCIYLIIGVESADQWVLDNVVRKQPLTIEHVESAFLLAKEAGLDMQAFYIIGFPRETLKQIHTTLNFAMEALKKYNVLPHMALARADPGTDLYAEAEKNGHLVMDYAVSNMEGVHADMFVRHLIRNDEFTPSQLEDLSRSFHRRAIRVVSAKTILFLLSHPWLVPRNIAYFSSWIFARDGSSFVDCLVKLFFTRLFYRRAQLDERRFESGEQTRWPDRESRPDLIRESPSGDGIGHQTEAGPPPSAP